MGSNILRDAISSQEDPQKLTNIHTPHTERKMAFEFHYIILHFIDVLSKILEEEMESLSVDDR